MRSVFYVMQNGLLEGLLLRKSITFELIFTLIRDCIESVWTEIRFTQYTLHIPLQYYIVSKINMWTETDITPHCVCTLCKQYIKILRNNKINAISVHNISQMWCGKVSQYHQKPAVTTDIRHVTDSITDKVLSYSLKRFKSSILLH